METAKQMRQRITETRKQREKIEEQLKKVGLREEWFARDNFIYAGKDEIGKNPIATCNSNIVALHITCAHNAVLKSKP